MYITFSTVFCHDVHPAIIIIIIYNEYFFRNLSNYELWWEVTKDGNAMKSGRVEELNVAPGATATQTLPLPKADNEGEWLLNVSYRLKQAEELLRQIGTLLQGLRGLQLLRGADVDAAGKGECGQNEEKKARHCQ